MWTEECVNGTFGPSKEGLARVVSIMPNGFVNVIYVDDGIKECHLSPIQIHAPSAMDKSKEKMKINVSKMRSPLRAFSDETLVRRSG